MKKKILILSFILGTFNLVHSDCVEDLLEKLDLVYLEYKANVFSCDAVGPMVSPRYSAMCLIESELKYISDALSAIDEYNKC